MKAIGRPVVVDFYEIRGWDTAGADGNCLVHCSEDKTFLITPAMTAREPAGKHHYVVVQVDGYIYLNPKEVFERKYTPIAVRKMPTPQEMEKIEAHAQGAPITVHKDGMVTVGDKPVGPVEP